MKKDDIDSIKGIIGRIAAELEPTEEWSPALFVVAQNGEHSLMPMPGEFLTSPENKRIMMGLIVEALMKLQAESCAFVSTAFAQTGEKMDNETPQEFFKRVRATKEKEVIFVNVCTADGCQVHISYITRSDKHPELGPWKEFGTDTVSGEFNDIIVPALIAVKGGN